LRWRLTLTYVGLLALLLAALGAYQYLALQRELVSVRVQSLTGDFNEVRTQIARLLPRDARTATDVTRVLAALCARLNGAALLGGGIAPERTFATALATASGRTATVVIYAADLHPVTSAPTDLDSAPRMSDAALASTVTAHEPSSAEILQSPMGEQLAVGFPIGSTRRGGACGVAQLSTSTDPINAVLDGERTRLAVGGGVVLVIAAMLGLLLTSRALRPLHRVSETARTLAGGELGARSNLPPRDDEVGTLSRSFDDMADRIEAAFAAQTESEQRMRRFVADASHELRTPVTALKGYIDVMRRGAARDPQALDGALETMSREADRMSALVLDLLTLARLDSHRPMELRPLDLGAAVARVLDEGVPGMPGDIARDLPSVTVMGDHNAVATIARNLLTNACKYAPGARQRWSLSRSATHGVLRVQDEGPGIPAGDLPHVFERFYRGEKTRARQEGGSGLGLSIVQGLVEAQGGTVAVESAEGSGTLFTVSLPLAQSAS
jgi:two-component system OmpR family sensor kinase